MRLIGKICLVLALILLGAGPSWGQAPWAPAARVAKKMQYDRGSVEIITGSRISRTRQSFLIAGEVRKSNQILPLRDENGRPLWARSRRQR